MFGDEPMKSNQGLCFCVIASIALWAGSANADDATITLDVNFSGAVGTAGTWQLSGRIDDTGSGANGDFGLSAVRALLDNIDFGTSGDAITFAPGNGAIDPLLDQFGNVVRPPVLQQTGGTIDLIYGQDLSESPTFPGSGTSNVVVPLVGTSGDVLIASGIFSAGATPAFGQDDTGSGTLFTQALFLTNGAAPYTGAIDANNTFTVTNLNTAGVTGDYNGNGVVDAADYTVWLDSLGSDDRFSSRWQWQQCG